MSHDAARIIEAIAEKGKNAVEYKGPRMATVWKVKPFTIVLDNVDMYITAPNIGFNWQLCTWNTTTHHKSDEAYIQGGGTFTHTSYTVKLPDGSEEIRYNKMQAENLEIEDGTQYEMEDTDVTGEVSDFSGDGIFSPDTYKAGGETLENSAGATGGNLTMSALKKAVQTFKGKIQSFQMKGKISIPGSRIAGSFSAQNTKSIFEPVLRVGDRVLVAQITNKYWVIVCKVVDDFEKVVSIE